MTTNNCVYIDLGLPSGLLWANQNIGALYPQNVGSYYAWGETEPKYKYNQDSYKHSKNYWFTMKKYCQKRLYGKVDKKVVLDDIDNIVKTINKNATIPSTKDFEELIEYCNWEFVPGAFAHYVCTSKINGNKIIFPITGNMIDNQLYSPTKGYYWTIDLNSINCYANIFFFNEDNPVKIRSLSRAYGSCIRPVIHKDLYEDPIEPEEPVEPEKPEIPELLETDDPFIAEIGTYNVRYWNGENDPNNQGEISWPNRRDKVFEFLMNEGIWGVQEVTSEMYPDFINKEGYKYIGYGRGNGLSNENASGEQIGIFYSTSLYQILDQGSFFYNGQSKSAFNRLCVWVKVQNLINGKKFYIFNNHLAHDSEEVRVNQVNTLLSKIPEITKDEKVFIIGDFNAVFDSEEYRIIAEMYKDSFIHSAFEPQGPNITYTGLYSTTDKEQKRVDYIFTNVYVETYKVDDNNKGLEKYPSDHYPVTITCLIE